MARSTFIEDYCHGLPFEYTRTSELQHLEAALSAVATTFGKLLRRLDGWPSNMGLEDFFTPWNKLGQPSTPQRRLLNTGSVSAALPRCVAW